MTRKQKSETEWFKKVNRVDLNERLKPVTNKTKRSNTNM